MIKGEKLGNPNVPKKARVIGSKVYASGEIVTSYYLINGQPYRVDDWVWSKPERASWDEIPDEVKDELD